MDTAAISCVFEADWPTSLLAKDLVQQGTSEPYFPEEAFFTSWRIMSARTKLNGIVIGGTLLVAATAGAVTSSWLVFAAITITGTILLIHAGEVRLKPGDHRLTPRGARRKPPRS